MEPTIFDAEEPEPEERTVRIVVSLTIRDDRSDEQVADDLLDFLCDQDDGAPYWSADGADAQGIRLADVALSDPTANAPGAAPTNPTDTTDAARWAIMPKTGTQRARILKLMIDAYDGPMEPMGYTDEELAHYAGMSPSSVRPRRGELVAGGWLRDSGRRSKTAAGLDAIVWELTPAAWRRYWSNQPLLEDVSDD